MNGSGQHGGSGAGGGYVPSQGWEFVPCTRMDRADRGRGKSRSPLRRISSPPTVFSQLYEPHFGAGLAGGEGGSGTQLEVLRGQMWPDQEPQQQQQPQTQRMRLKKKIEDLKKQHIQDKEGWMREKESLLREVADIQVIGNNWQHLPTNIFDFICQYMACGLLDLLLVHMVSIANSHFMYNSQICLQPVLFTSLFNCNLC